MKIKSVITCICIFYCLLCSSPSALAQEYGTIDWSKLNLSNAQIKKFEELDRQWQAINNSIRACIARDQQLLQKYLTDPNVSEQTIRSLYMSILAHNQRLKYCALEIYLAKRRLLTKQQLQNLPKVMQ